jgi:hypothetical protein
MRATMKKMNENKEKKRYKTLKAEKPVKSNNFNVNWSAAPKPSVASGASNPFNNFDVNWSAAPGTNNPFNAFNTNKKLKGDNNWKNNPFEDGTKEIRENFERQIANMNNTGPFAEAMKEKRRENAKPSSNNFWKKASQELAKEGEVRNAKPKGQSWKNWLRTTKKNGKPAKNASTMNLLGLNEPPVAPSKRPNTMNANLLGLSNFYTKPTVAPSSILGRRNKAGTRKVQWANRKNTNERSESLEQVREIPIEKGPGVKSAYGFRSPYEGRRVYNHPNWQQRPILNRIKSFFKRR